MGSAIGIVTGSTQGYLGAAGEVFRASVRAYARGRGYGYHSHTDFDPDRPPSWSKIRFLRAHLREHEVLVWVDADVYAGPLAGRLEPVLSGPEPVTLTADRNGPNCGVFALRTGPWAEAFLDWVWARTEHMHHPWWEQAAVHERFRDEPAAFRLAPKRVLNAYPHEVGPETIFAHFPGDTRGHADWFAAHVAHADAVGDAVAHLRIPPSVTRMDDAHVALLAGLVMSHKPDRVTEIGCGWGTTRALAQALAYNRTGVLTVVDNWCDYGGEAGRPPVEEWVRPCDRIVTADEGDFLAAQPEGRIDFFVCDGNHHASDRHLPLALRAVRSGGVMCWHDTGNADFPNLGRIREELARANLGHHHFARATRPGERTERGLLVAFR